MRTLIVDDEPLARNELTYLLNEIGVIGKKQKAIKIEINRKEK